MAYSTDFKAKAIMALAANEGNITKTANELGIAKATLWKWTNEQKQDPELYTLLETAAKNLLENMPDFTKQPHAWPNALQVVIKTMQLVSGEATERRETNVHGEHMVGGLLAGLTAEHKEKVYEEAGAIIEKALENGVVDENGDELSAEEVRQLVNNTETKQLSGKELEKEIEAIQENAN